MKHLISRFGTNNHLDSRARPTKKYRVKNYSNNGITYYCQYVTKNNACFKKHRLFFLILIYLLITY